MKLSSPFILTTLWFVPGATARFRLLRIPSATKVQKSGRSELPAFQRRSFLDEDFHAVFRELNYEGGSSMSMSMGVTAAPSYAPKTLSPAQSSVPSDVPSSAPLTASPSLPLTDPVIPVLTTSPAPSPTALQDGIELPGVDENLDGDKSGRSKSSSTSEANVSNDGDGGIPTAVVATIVVAVAAAMVVATVIVKKMRSRAPPAAPAEQYSLSDFSSELASPGRRVAV